MWLLNNCCSQFSDDVYCTHSALPLVFGQRYFSWDWDISRMRSIPFSAKILGHLYNYWIQIIMWSLLNNKLCMIIFLTSVHCWVCKYLVYCFYSWVVCQSQCPGSEIMKGPNRLKFESCTFTSFVKSCQSSKIWIASS